MSVGSILRSLTDITKDHVFVPEELNNPVSNHDRGHVVGTICRIELILQRYIVTNLPMARDETDFLFKDNNLLETFQSKIQMGRALNLYGKETAACLTLLKSIRNVFAHSCHPITLESPEIQTSLAAINIEVFVIRENILPKSSSRIVFAQKTATMIGNLAIHTFLSCPTTDGKRMIDLLKSGFVAPTQDVADSVSRILALAAPLP